MSDSRTLPSVTFRRELGPGGRQIMVGVLAEELPAGATVRLIRLHRGGRPGPEFVACRIPEPPHEPADLRYAGP